MAITTLSLIGTPGVLYSFVAKDAAPLGGPHLGLFTTLSLTATPGVIHSFSPKSAELIVTGPHTGLFTALSVLAIPRRTQLFTGKDEAPAERIYEQFFVSPVRFNFGVKEYSLFNRYINTIKFVYHLTSNTQ